MPSFDVVSEVDVQEVRNAVDQANREIDKRFDFRGVDASFELKGETIELAAFEDFQLTQMLDMLRSKLISRKVDARALEPGTIEGVGKQRRQKFTLKNGVDQDRAKKIVKLIKESKLKVQAQIQGNQVRVQGKKRDDLQKTMAMIKDADFDLPLQYENFRD